MIEDLQKEWILLWSRSARATPFQSPAWLTPWFAVFAPGAAAFVEARREGTLIGLAPLYVEEGASRRLLPIGIGLTDHLDVLLDPDFETEAGAALSQAIDALDWDACAFEDLAPDAAALILPSLADAKETLGDADPCPVLTLGDSLAASVPARRMRKIAMARRRAARRGAVEIRRAEDEADVQAALEDLFRLHGARWRSRGGPGVLDDAKVRRFHRLAAPALAKEGLLRLYSLQIGGQLAGVYYGFAHRDRAYAYLGGFDPDFAFESPGALLIANAIEDAVREGAREFHFLRGGESYKYEWGARDRLNRRRIFMRRPFSACLDVKEE